MLSCSPMTQRDPNPARERILATVDAIPRGRVATYGQIASEAGLPRRARLVGRILGELPANSRIPWFRVLNASGQVSDRGQPKKEAAQRKKLEREGVRFSASGRTDLKRYGWGGD